MGNAAQKTAAQAAVCTAEEKTPCPVTYAIGIIGGKWQLPIIWALSKTPVLRYSELKRRLEGVTSMMLTQSLKELEKYGLLRRKQYNEIPPRVEYSLTEAGLALLPAINELAKWGEKRMRESGAGGSASRGAPGGSPAQK